MTNKFNKPPLSIDQKEKKAQDFIDFAIEKQSQDIIEKPVITMEFKKEKAKTLLLRLPESLKNDLHKVVCLTGISMNAICIELIRPALKRKLKELLEE